MQRDQLDAALKGTRASHAPLRETLEALTDDHVAEPSLLPGWTRGHLLTHVARNADSHVRLLTAAAGGEKVEQYVGGIEGRAADIEAGAGRSAAELVADVEDSARRLFDVWDDVPEPVWDEVLQSDRPVWTLVFSRWRETEIHHADLALGYTYDDWPSEFVAVTLPHVGQTLDRRLPSGAAIELVAADTGWRMSAGSEVEQPITVEGPAGTLLAWLAGRPIESARLKISHGELPELGPWA